MNATYMQEYQELNYLIDNIQNVSCDMLPAFIKGVKENLPKTDLELIKAMAVETEEQFRY